MFFSTRTLGFLAVFGGVVSAASSVDGNSSDWKYGVGWDGKVLDPTAIGEPVGSVPIPVPNTTASSLQPLTGTIGGVYICEDIHWGGKCGYAVQPLDTCIKLGSDWDKKISSFGPDPCTFCGAWDDSNCNKDGENDNSKFWFFQFPGKDDGGIGLPYPDGGWNDQISSFECEKIANCQN